MLLNRTIAIFFLLIFLCSSFSAGIITLAFYANQQYIANNLCINRDKPQMHCNGKCQLQKKLNRENNKDKQSPERKNDSRNEVLSSKCFFASVERVVLKTAVKKYLVQNINCTKDQSLSFFHPPQSLFM